MNYPEPSLGLQKAVYLAEAEEVKDGTVRKH